MLHGAGQRLHERWIRRRNGFGRCRRKQTIKQWRPTSVFSISHESFLPEEGEMGKTLFIPCDCQPFAATFAFSWFQPVASGDACLVSSDQDDHYISDDHFSHTACKTSFLRKMLEKNIVQIGFEPRT
jgi:hypothetical protein